MVAGNVVQRHLDPAHKGQRFVDEPGITDPVGYDIAGMHHTGDFHGKRIELLNDFAGAFQVIAAAKMRIGNLGKIEMDVRFFLRMQFRAATEPYDPDAQQQIPDDCCSYGGCNENRHLPGQNGNGKSTIV